MSSFVAKAIIALIAGVPSTVLFVVATAKVPSADLSIDQLLLGSIWMVLLGLLASSTIERKRPSE
jgi:hypothetical protein